MAHGYPVVTLLLLGIFLFVIPTGCYLLALIVNYFRGDVDPRKSTRL